MYKTTIRTSTKQGEQISKAIAAYRQRGTNTRQKNNEHQEKSTEHKTQAITAMTKQRAEMNSAIALTYKFPINEKTKARYTDQE